MQPMRIKKKCFVAGSPVQGHISARQGRFLSSDMITVTDPPRGRPVGGGGGHRTEWRVCTIPSSYPVHSMFTWDGHEREYARNRWSHL